MITGAIRLIFYRKFWYDEERKNASLDRSIGFGSEG